MPHTNPPTLWIVDHPATNTHPGAFLAFTDPTPALAHEQPLELPCWLFGCTCFHAYTARRATLDELYAAAHTATQAAAATTPAPADPNRGNKRETGSQGRSGRIDGDLRIDEGSA
ncbi:hypothetical protein [Microcystis phage Mwe-JY05]